MRRWMACALPFVAPCHRFPPITARPLIHPRVARTASIALRLVLLALASWALRRGLAGVHAAQLWSQFHAYGWRHAALALGCTAASFVTLGLIEVMALRAAGLHSRIPRRAAMTTAFVTHAFSQSVGLALLTGAAVRLRAYARYRMDAAAVGRTSAFVTLTVTLGLIACGAGAFLAGSEPLRLLGRELAVRPVGLMLAIVAFAYVVWSATALREVVGRGRWQIRRPTARVAMGQLLLSSVDWLLTGTVLFALLPASAGIGYGEMLRAYLIAQTVGVASHIPGGAGVFEAVMFSLVARGDMAQQAAIVAALVMFRIVYYLLPLISAVIVSAVAELRLRGSSRIMASRAAAERGALQRVG